MKRFLRFLLFVAVVAAVVWATRERMLPTPPPPASEPPPFRHPPEPLRAAVAPEPATEATASEAAAPESKSEPEPAAARPAPSPTDDLQRVKGIGPVYEAKLTDQGITTYTALIGADSEDLAAALDVSVAMIVDWKTQATEFLG